MKWSAPKLWPDSTIVILGGGPSLTPEQVEHAKQFRRIATNNAFMLDPEAEVLCWGDTYWWLENWQRIAQHKGEYKVTWRQAPEMQNGPHVKVMIHRKGPPFIDPSPCCIAGPNTGHGAINLAVHLGAARILLLGFDMNPRGGHNWHTLHKRHADQNRYDKVFIPAMEGAAKELKALGIEIVNCSTVSSLTCFPFGKIEEMK